MPERKLLGEGDVAEEPQRLGPRGGRACPGCVPTRPLPNRHSELPRSALKVPGSVTGARYEPPCRDLSNSPGNADHRCRRFADTAARSQRGRAARPKTHSEAFSGTSCLPSPSTQPWKELPCSLKQQMRAERESHVMISRARDSLVQAGKPRHRTRA